MPKAIPNPQAQWTLPAHRPDMQRTRAEQETPPEISLNHGHSVDAFNGWRAAESVPLPSEREENGISPRPNLPEPQPKDANPLLAENVQLRNIIAELQDLVEEAANQNELGWTDRQKEYEHLLEEKSELIRTLHVKIQELEERKQAPAATPREEELQRMNEELEQERCTIEQERRELEEDLRQFKEDEKIMTQQMREMEVLMARERAELARQRSEVQRIMDEVRQELERMERDRGLSEKLTQLRQRFQTVAKGKSGSGEGPPTQAAFPEAVPHKDDSGSKKKDSGFMRRMFGQ